MTVIVRLTSGGSPLTERSGQRAGRTIPDRDADIPCPRARREPAHELMSPLDGTAVSYDSVPTPGARAPVGPVQSQAAPARDLR